jgi:alpha-tubulin suppressor-like RCC1 family protein
MKRYAIEINFEGKVLRYSTEPYTEIIDIDGEQSTLSYLPHILSIELGECTVSIEGSGSIPSVSVSLWDGNLFLFNNFSEVDYESADVKIYDIEQEKFEIFSGYLTEFSQNENVASFSVRLDERLYLKEGIWKKFTANSFQNFDIRKPVRVDLATSWMRKEDMIVEIAGCPVWTSVSGSDLSLTVGEVPAISNPTAKIVDLLSATLQDSSGSTTRIGQSVVVSTLDKFDIPVYGGALYGDLNLDIPNTVNAETFLFMLGANDHGQLGRIYTGGSKADPKSVWPDIDGSGFDTDDNLFVMDANINFVQISCGFDFNLAICSEGYLWSWGRNNNGQLGIGQSVENQPYPRKVTQSNDWAFISAGYYHSLAIKNDGTLWAWGANGAGKTGLRKLTGITYFPERVGISNDWAYISAGAWHSLAIKKDGTLWAWGSNLDGRTGRDRTSGSTDRPIIIETSQDWQSISAGWNHSLAIKNDGTLWAWGNNGEYQLGNGNQDALKVATQIGTSSGWAKVSAGKDFSVALTTDSAIYSWGDNSKAKTGRGTRFSNTETPQKIGSDNDWKEVVAGVEHCLALKKDNSVWGWGANGENQVGSQNIVQFTPFFSILTISTLPPAPAAQPEPRKISGFKNNGILISAGGEHSGVVKLNQAGNFGFASQDGRTYLDLRSYYLRPVFNFSKDPDFKGIVLSWEESFSVENNSDVEEIYNSSGSERGENYAAIGWPNNGHYEVFKYEYGIHSNSEGAPSAVKDSNRVIGLRNTEFLGGGLFRLPRAPIKKGEVPLFFPKWREMINAGKFIPIVPLRIKSNANFNGLGAFAPIHTEVIVKTNVFAPPDLLTNPEFYLGYLMFDPQFKDEIRFLSSDVRAKSRNKREKIFRYKIIDADIINGQQHLKLEIHNSVSMDERFVKNYISEANNADQMIAGNAIDPSPSDDPSELIQGKKVILFDKFKIFNSYLRHDYHYNNAQALDIFPQATEVSVGEKFVTMYPNRQVKRIDFDFGFSGPEFKNAKYSNLKNRLKGLRIEVVKNYESMVRSLGSISDSGSNDSEINMNIINNITGEYAVAKNSRVYYDESLMTVIERVNFDVEGGQTGQDSITVTTDDSKGTLNLDSDPKLINLLSYNSYDSKLNLDASNHDQVFGSDAAKIYFLRQVYRVIKDPVPPGSKDVGKFFPMMYGYVRRYPMIHAISSDITMESSSAKSAGNDVYIFSLNPCNISNSSDVTIHLEEESGKINEAELGFSVLWPHIIQSPFPNFIQDHSYRLNGRNYVSGIETPYHRVESFETLSGDTLYGIKLRGFEWDQEMGISDKRFPIRNGVGTTNLLIDVAGAYDPVSGQTYLHPCDIVIHFIRENCEFPFSENIIDLDSFQRVKSLTRWYVASVPLPEETTPFDLLDSICNQFGYFWHLNYGKIYLGILDMSNVEYDKFISEAGDIVGKVSEVDEGYKNTYSEIEYNYFKDWSNGSFRYSINLNKDNNKYCAIASLSKGGKGAYKVDAQYVTETNVAIDVSNRLAEFLSRRRKVYRCQIRKRGLQYIPGEVIQVSYAPLNLRYDEVLVASVKDVGATYEISFIKFF